MHNLVRETMWKAECGHTRAHARTKHGQCTLKNVRKNTHEMVNRGHMLRVRFWSWVENSHF